jgi:hypothetical protein
LSTERLLEAVTLDSASETIALGVRPNKSEDLSISERIWVASTLNDFIVGFDTGALPLEELRRCFFGDPDGACAG